MGKYGALFDEAPTEAPEKGGKYGALFEPDPRFVDTDEPEAPAGAAARTFPKNTEFNANVEALGQMSEALKQPSRLERVGQGLKALGSAVRHPAETATTGAKRREMLRGIDDMVTLGYGQDAANYLGQKLGDKPEQSLAALAQPDAEAAPGYRVAGSIPGAFLPGAVSHIAKEAGATIKALAPVAETASPLVKTAAGGARGVASYAASAPVIAAASAGSAGNRLGAAKDALLDPVGLALSGVAGAAGAGVPAAFKKAVAGAPAAETKAILADAAQGPGRAGAATKTARMLLDRNKENVGLTVKEDPELWKAIGKEAKEALPVVQDRLEQWGSKLDPHYDVVDKATGGVSLHNLVNTLDQEVARLKGTPLNEQYVRAVNDIKVSALRAWAPEMMQKLQGAQRMEDLGLEIPEGLFPQDIKVPTKAVRAMVTRLQTRGSQVINPLNPGEASQMKADMGAMMKSFIDSHLDVAADASPEVQAAVNDIRAINKRYSGLSTIQKAIEQRQWKEETGGQSMAETVKKAVSHASPTALAMRVGAAVAKPLAKAVTRGTRRGLARINEAGGIPRLPESISSRLPEAPGRRAILANQLEALRQENE